MSGSHRLPFPLRGRPSRNTVSRQRLGCQRSTFILKECTLKPNRNVFLNLTRLFLNKYWTHEEQIVNLTQLEEQPSTKWTFKCHKSRKRKSRSRKSSRKKSLPKLWMRNGSSPFLFSETWVCMISVRGLEKKCCTANMTKPTEKWLL